MSTGKFISPAADVAALMRLREELGTLTSLDHAIIANRARTGHSMAPTVDYAEEHDAYERWLVRMEATDKRVRAENKAARKEARAHKKPVRSHSEQIRDLLEA